MGSIGDTIDEPIPPVTTAGITYATQINAFLEEVKTRLEVPFPLSAIDPTGGLDLEGQPLDNAHYVGLEDQLVTPAGSPISRFEAYNGDVYWVGAAGAVRVTNGGFLDVTSAGGIGGDYGSTSAGLNYVAATKSYEFYSDSSALEWAFAKLQAVDFTESITGTHKMRLQWQGSTSGTYTLPVAAPAAATSLLTMTTAGAILTNGLVGQDVVFSGVLTSSAGGLFSAGLTSTNATVLSGGTTCTNGFSASGTSIIGTGLTLTGVTALTMTGTARPKHGIYKSQTNLFSIASGTGNPSFLTGAMEYDTNGGVTTWHIPVEAGWRLRTIEAVMDKTTTGATSLAGSDRTTAIPSSGGSSTTIAANQAIVLTLTGGYVVDETSNITVAITTPDCGAAVSDRVYSVYVTYDEI
jgi:hypothetical protein